MKDTPKGILRFNAPSLGDFMNKTVASFLKEYDQITLHIDYSDRVVDILSQGYDLSVRVGVLKDSSLIARKLLDCPLFLCASKEYLANSPELKTPEHLNHHRGIIYTKNREEKEWIYVHPSGQIGTAHIPGQYNDRFRRNDVRSLFTRGLGVTLLPPRFQSGRLYPQWSFSGFAD